MFGLPLAVVGAIGAVVVLLIGLMIFRSMWKVPEPNEALVISGGKRTNASGSAVYRVVVGHGSFANPLFSIVRRMSLQAMKTNLEVESTTKQGIRVRVLGVVVFKVGDTEEDITAAAKRFLDQQGAKMEDLVFLAFEGHLRSILGGLTVEELITDRDALTAQVLAAAGADVLKLGLAIDSFQIREIDDPSKYIDNLAAPHIADARMKARIAQANSDQLAAAAEAEANARKAEANAEAAGRTAEADQIASTRKANAQAAIDKANAEAAQAGPLAAATARLKVTEAETKAAELAATLKEQQLQTEVRKPADAEAYRRQTLANAERLATIAAAQAQAETQRLLGNAEADATRATGQAKADAKQANGEAEAATIAARAKALAENQQAVLLQGLVERFPEIVAAAAAPLGNIDQLTVLNGAEGVNQIVSQVLGNAFALFPGLQDKLTTFAGTPVTAAASTSGRDGS